MPAADMLRHPATRSGIVAATVIVALGAGSAMAEWPASDDPSDAMIGRWTGSGYIRGVVQPGALPITFEVQACGNALCLRPVRPDGTCAEVLAEIDRTGLAEKWHPAAPHNASYHGRVVRPGQPLIEITVTHVPPASDRPAYLLLRDASTPLYSRRLPDAVSVSLSFQGAAACEARPTS